MTRGCPSADRRRGARCFGSEPLATPIPTSASQPADRACVARARHTRRSFGDRHPPRQPNTRTSPRLAHSSRSPRYVDRVRVCARTAAPAFSVRDHRHPPTHFPVNSRRACRCRRRHRFSPRPFGMQCIVSSPSSTHALSSPVSPPPFRYQ